MSMTKNEQSQYELDQVEFSKATSLAAAADVVWNRTASGRGMYQRYTTLDKVLKIIRDGRWYLSRGDAQNDLREAKRSKEIAAVMRRTYLMCLMKGAGESVAMWYVYGRNDPLAVRISIPRTTIEDKWMNPIANGAAFFARDSKGLVVDQTRIEPPVFRDMIYVAIRDKKVQDEYDIRRTNVMSWEGAKTELCGGDSIFKESQEPKFAGWIKDYEWCHERESRLCLRLNEEIHDKVISIAIPREVIADMRFTFSPWLTDFKLQEAIEEEIRDVYEKVGIKLKKRPQRFRRSVLQGVLNI